MSHASRRRGDRPRLRVETLEARALLASAGSLDPSFGGGYGSSTVSIDVPVLSTIWTTAESVTTTPDGHILVQDGITSNPSKTVVGGFQFATALVELNANGALNTSFGTDGQVILPGGLITVMPNGGIIVSTTSPVAVNGGGSYLAYRLNPNGSRDMSFGTDGFAEYPANTTTVDRVDDPTLAVPLPNNQLLLVQGGSTGFAAVRLNADGSLDTSYGQDGTATVTATNGSQAGGSAALQSATLQANGQLILTGTISYFAGFAGLVKSQIVVTRLNSDGSLDTSFGGSAAAGIVEIPTGLADPKPVIDFAEGVAVQPTSGDVLVAGQEGSSDTLYRLNTDGTLDTTFGTGGVVTTGNDMSDDIQSISVEADGDIVLGGFYAIGNANPLYVSQLNPDGTPDASFGNTTSPGLLQLTRLAPADTEGEPKLSSTIDPTTGDILLPGVAAVGSLTGLTYGVTVDSILTTSTTGPSAHTPTPASPADLTGLGLSDLAVYNVSTGIFVTATTSDVIPLSSSAGPNTFGFGIPGAGQTIPAVADYQGIGVSQFAAYLPASGVYAIYPTATSPGLFQQFGMAGAGNSIPVPADYYGTGQADVAVYMPSIASFAIMATATQPGRIIPFGIPGAGQSIPAPADYYNTGQDDIAVYLAQAGAFAILAPGGASGEVIPFGKPGIGQSIPVPGDYDGSGKTELAVYIPSLGAFFYRPADGQPDVRVPIGIPNSGEIPVPGDYDGSGRTEAAIYDPTTGVLLYQPAKGGPAVGILIGTPNNGSIPVTAPAGALPEFAAPGSGGGGNAIRPNFVPSGSSGLGSTAAITLSTASTVPAGPTLASVRVARALVNQAAPDPLDLD